MRLTIAVIQPAGYLHSRAFEEVALSLRSGLLASGHEAQIEHGLHFFKHVPAIVLGANLLPHFPTPLPDDSVLYNLEQVDLGSAWFPPTMLELCKKYPVWDYSHANIRAFAGLGVTAQHVPLGWAPELERIFDLPEQERDIDVILVGSMNDRRRKICEGIIAEGLKLTHLFGVYGQQRDMAIGRSKIVLNAHYYESKVLEMVRISYMLTNRRFVVTEGGIDDDENRALSGGVGFVPADGSVAKCCADWCRLFSHDERQAIADNGWRAFRKQPISTIMKDAVQATWGDRVDRSPAARLVLLANEK